MPDCLFCKIIAGEIPSKMIYEDEDVVAFDDLHPKAPIHILIVPRKHIATLNDCELEDKKLLGHLSLVAKQISKEKGIDESGYRTVMNCNRDAGQVIFHIHMHLVGGRNLKL